MAAIPLVAADPLWLQEHAGVLRAADEEHVRVFWNGPDRADDVQRQISLVEQTQKEGYAGLILAPAQKLALTLPIKQILARGMPVVVVHAPLSLPAGDGLAYVVNDEQLTGRMAALLVAQALHGHGRVAITGVQPLHPAAMERMRAFEDRLSQTAPGVQVAARVATTQDDFAAEESLKPFLHGHGAVNAVFALDTTAGLGAARAVTPLAQRPVVVVYGQDPMLLAGVQRGTVRAEFAEDSQMMGFTALHEIMRMRRGQPVPGTVLVPPLLVTAGSLHDADVLARVVNLPEEPL